MGLESIINTAIAGTSLLVSLVSLAATICIAINTSAWNRKMAAEQKQSELKTADFQNKVMKTMTSFEQLKLEIDEKYDAQAKKVTFEQKDFVALKVDKELEAKLHRQGDETKIYNQYNLFQNSKGNKSFENIQSKESFNEHELKRQENYHRTKLFVKSNSNKNNRSKSKRHKRGSHKHGKRR